MLGGHFQNLVWFRGRLDEFHCTKQYLFYESNVGTTDVQES